MLHFDDNEAGVVTFKTVNASFLKWNSLYAGCVAKNKKHLICSPSNFETKVQRWREGRDWGDQ